MDKEMDKIVKLISEDEELKAQLKRVFLFRSSYYSISCATAVRDLARMIYVKHGIDIEVHT